MHALELETVGLTKRFGAFTALADCSLKVRPGTVHALLGENGAGKSTLVKCIVGYYRADAGSVLVDGREHDIHSPVVARELGIGMVYQHFTVVPGMTVAENLLLARGRLPALIDWKAVRAELESFMQTTPFRLALDATPLELSAGEKQKLEILKQLLLRPRLLILDEPTSVLTPQEADEVLGVLRERAHAGDCSIVMITHKFREVTEHADDVSVLRRGRLVATGPVAETTPQELARAMIGESQAGAAAPAGAAEPRTAAGAAPGEVRLAIRGLEVAGDRGELAVRGLTLEVRAGEIVGIAGVSGNGQRELMQAIVGQRAKAGGTLEVAGERFDATRAQNRRLKVRSLPEEPLANACVGELSVAHNMGLRQYDEPPFAAGGWVRWSRLRERARRWIGEFRVKTQGERAAIRTLSGGNIQRAVLARELSNPTELLLVSNPVFGLDFVAVAEVHSRLANARDRGTAVLMVSEDLDELLEVADRLVVISGGKIVYECPTAGADRHEVGRHMGGHAPAGGHGGATGTPARRSERADAAVGA